MSIEKNYSEKEIREVIKGKQYKYCWCLDETGERIVPANTGTALKDMTKQLDRVFNLVKDKSMPDGYYTVCACYRLQKGNRVDNFIYMKGKPASGQATIQTKTSQPLKENAEPELTSKQVLSYKELLELQTEVIQLRTTNKSLEDKIKELEDEIVEIENEGVAEEKSEEEKAVRATMGATMYKVLDKLADKFLADKPEKSVEENKPQQQAPELTWQQVAHMVVTVPGLADYINEYSNQFYTQQQQETQP